MAHAALLKTKKEPPISLSLILLHMAAAVCLLLWGTKMVRRGFTRAYGTSLGKMIRSGTGNRFTAFFSGMGVTAILQSSTAMILLLSSFAKKNMVALPASIAVILGADVSTTLVAQILTFDLSWLAPVFLIVGIGGHMNARRGGRNKHIFYALIGLGLMLLSLSLIRQASGPIQSSEILPLVLAPLQGEPVLAILLAALFTWILHSSLAGVLLFATLAGNGLIPLELGILLIIGANLGGAVVPFAVTYKDGAAVRQVTGANVVMRGFAVVISLGLLTFLPGWVNDLSADPARQLVHFHTAFNVALALFFLPLSSIVARLSIKLFPEKKTRQKKSDPQFLDENALGSPLIALACAARETLRMAEMVQKMLENTIHAFEQNDMAIIQKIRTKDDTVDQLYGSIKHYMTQLSQESLDPKEADRYIQVLTFSTNLEHIGDIIDNSLMELAQTKVKKQESFSDDGLQEIKDFHNKVVENMKLAQAIFMSEDPKLAADLVAEKAVIRMAAHESSEQHFKRLSEGLPETIATSNLHLDIIRDYRRINSYITRVAYAILENAAKYQEQRKN